MPLIRRSFAVGALGCNCSVVVCPDTKEALVVDPGDEAPRMLEALAAQGARAVKIVHTHAHFDHVMGTGQVAADTGAEILVHAADRWLYDNVPLQTQLFGLPCADDAPPPPPTRELAGDEALAFGRREARALHTPGTPPARCASSSSTPARRRSSSRETRCSAARLGAPICGEARPRPSCARSATAC